MQRQPKSAFKKFLIHIILIFLCIFQIGPLIIVLLNTFRSEGDIKLSPIGLPTLFSFENYIKTWQIGGYGQAYLNGLFTSLITILAVCTLTCLMAFALTKLNIYGARFFVAYFFIAVSIPSFSFLVTDYFIFTKIGLINSLWSVIITYTATNIPFNLILMRSFLLGIPKELEEAGKIDGCSEIKSLLYITIPLAKPILCTTALLVFVSTWNEFLFANTYLQSDSVKTVAVRFYKFIGKYSNDPAKIYSAAIITIAPVVILYLVLQRNFIEGITTGSIKG